ncbi:Fur family transcriptional regulator [Marseilla massiliensis]|jgi:Fur family ferric uptake transcriptional regulator|uniref:Transcriptional repressor n=1 Tax=Marseilla massiliensis TaxID=1841864 RepID=A0A938WL33_9BACT|nr:transcriptional repressor [Marseilla massiliensis]MBM6661024.1 transcriptional repressor [Marseilla massiliensis]MCL1611508.1 transcriptional repressor [Marseilla massiliensis]MEE0361201.1 transcriptional repressor [Prevotella sp.]
MDVSKIEEILQGHGIKPTSNRIVVLRELTSAERPMSLTELEYKILSIDKSGIFRALSVFKEHHLVHVLEDGGDGVRYEFCRSHSDDADDDLHAHFYCERCRQTFCLEDIAVPQVELPGGYEAVSVNYMIKGICPECARKHR